MLRLNSTQEKRRNPPPRYGHHQARLALGIPDDLSFGVDAYGFGEVAAWWVDGRVDAAVVEEEVCRTPPHMALSGHDEAVR
jgi:hypothetical protein